MSEGIFVSSPDSGHNLTLKDGVPHTHPKQLDERTTSDFLKRALAEWIAFRQNRARSAQQTRPTLDWLGVKLSQRIVDELQELLDSHERADPVFRNNHVSLLRFLSWKFQILPSSLTIQNIKREGGTAVTGGGCADIWRGTLHGAQVCLKVLRIFVEQDAKARDILRKEFCREALIWRQLRHPNILPLFGVNIKLFSPSFCLVSPWMENRDIITYLKRNPDHNLHIALSEVAAGLRYMHSIVPPLVHGDIKGANILVTDDRRCCLADFGLSVITTNSQAWTRTTSSNFTGKGTVRWLAPEYLASETPNRPSRDIYAFGCTVLEIFTQKPPFYDRKNEIALLSYVMNGGRPDRPQDDRYSDALWGITTLCWAQNIEERPSADQIHECLNGKMFVPSSSAYHPSIISLFNLGCDYEQQKEYDHARDAFEQIVRLNPGDAKALQRLGRLYLQDQCSFQNQELAVHYFTQSLGAGKYKRTISLLQITFYVSDSSDSQSWYFLGQAYKASQIYSQAYQAYQQAIYRDSGNPAFWCSIGILFFHFHQFRNALDAYSRAIRVNPYISELWFNLGGLYENGDQITDAIDAYTRARELDPENRDISNRLQLLKTAQATGGRLPVALAPRDVHPTAYAQSGLHAQSGLPLLDLPQLLNLPGSLPQCRPSAVETSPPFQSQGFPTLPFAAFHDGASLGIQHLNGNIMAIHWQERLLQLDHLIEKEPLLHEKNKNLENTILNLHSRRTPMLDKKEKKKLLWPRRVSTKLFSAVGKTLGANAFGTL